MFIEYPKCLYKGEPENPDWQTVTVENAAEEAAHAKDGWKTAEVFFKYGQAVEEPSVPRKRGKA